MPPKKKKSKTSKSRTKRKIRNCSVNSCSKKATNLKKCPLCGDYFCKDHIKSKPPGNPIHEKNPLRADLMRDENAHPCFGYQDFIDYQQKEKDKRYLEVLDSVSGKIKTVNIKGSITEGLSSDKVRQDILKREKANKKVWDERNKIRKAEAKKTRSKKKKMSGKEADKHYKKLTGDFEAEDKYLKTGKNVSQQYKKYMTNKLIKISLPIIIILIFFSLLIFFPINNPKYNDSKQYETNIPYSMNVFGVGSKAFTNIEDMNAEVESLCENFCLGINEPFINSDLGDKGIDCYCNHTYKKPLFAFREVLFSFFQDPSTVGAFIFKTCDDGFILKQGSCVLDITCSDGTLNYDCSNEKPKKCVDGTLILKATDCGCPNDHRIVGDDCVKIQRCNDGTIYGQCSTDKPLYCDNGVLINKAGSCGCLAEEVVDDDNCVSRYETSPKEVTLNYVLDGNEGSIKFTVYKGLNDYLSEIPRYYYCDPVCPTDRELELRYLDEEKQDDYLDDLVDKIKSKVNGKENQARIAISLVQRIPYDWEGYTTNSLTSRYPYEVLYDLKGVCGEKSHLLAYLLRELGFGVVLYHFEVESHMTVGVKCPSKYAYKYDDDHCFIEAAGILIPTYDESEYVGVGELMSVPDIILISDGDSFDSIRNEYDDAQEWKRLNDLGPVLSHSDYDKWWDLVDKYGIELDD